MENKFCCAATIQSNIKKINCDKRNKCHLAKCTVLIGNILIFLECVISICNVIFFGYFKIFNVTKFLCKKNFLGQKMLVKECS